MSKNKNVVYFFWSAKIQYLFKRKISYFLHNFVEKNFFISIDYHC